MGAEVPIETNGVAAVEAAAPPPSAQEVGKNGAGAQQPPAYASPPPGQHGPPPPTYGQPVYGHQQAPPGAAYVSAPEPIFGIPIRAPLVTPQPGHVIVGYQIIEPPSGGCYMDLKLEGWLIVLLLLLVFWPLAWIPCCLPECYQRYQVPVYGFPGQSIPIAQPHY